MAAVANAEFTIPKKYPTNRSGPVRWIFSHAIQKWPLILLLILGAIGNAAFLGQVQIYVGQAFNAVLASPPNQKLLLRLAILIAGMAFMRGALQFGRNFGAELLAQKVERDIRTELYVSLLGKSMTFHNLSSVGDIMARATNDVREVNYLFSPGLNMVVGSLIFLIMPILLAPHYHPSLVITPILFIVFYFITLRYYLKRLGPVADEVRTSFGQMNSRLSEALEGIETVKGSSQEDAEVKRFSQNAGKYRDMSVKQGRIEATFLPMLLLSIAWAVGGFHALYLYIHGVINLGDVVGYNGLLLMLDFPTFTSLWAYSQISLGLAGGRRILELINREDNLDQNAAGHADAMVGEVEFRNVNFSHNAGSETLMLENISFKVKPGQTVAIVGQTGSGKTSLVKLINRTYDVTQGQVLVDGVDVREWNLEALRRGISIIEQDIFLFSRSLADNIAFGRPDARPEDIVRAAKAAQADEFVSGFEQAYETVVGDRGVTLSGGQRQRIALARAFLTDPRILILDDSTSAIDSATEDKIQRAIYSAAKGRTTFLITHRLSQIRWADLIIVLRKGQISAMGTHEELLDRSEAYRRIFSE